MIGIVAYSIVVLYQKHFSALAGGVALAIMMVPTICRTTEEMLLLVPQALREAAYGLGIPRWRTTLSITLRTATSGVITGIMLALPAWREKRPRCCLLPSAISSGMSAQTSPRPHCRCRYSIMRYPLTTSGIARRGRERSC